MAPTAAGFQKMRLQDNFMKSYNSLMYKISCSNSFMKICLAGAASILLMMFAMADHAKAQSSISAEKIGSKVDVYIDGRFFTSYIYSRDEKYPFFYPVNGPSGASVTSKRNSNFPHHSSLFFGADHVNGGNYWQEGLDKGQIISVKTEIIEEGQEQVVIANECLWVRPGADAPIKDTRRIRISSPADDIYQIDFDIKLHMLQDVTIARTNHSLFSGRMDPDLAVTHGGTMVNAGGKEGESGTFGEPSPWVSYYGNRGGNTEGMTIMQHPSNEWYPAPWFTRDYGFFSPTPLYWPEDEEAGTFLQEGEVVELRYRVLVHRGDHQDAEISRHFDLYIND
jgi:hypothetical protein